MVRIAARIDDVADWEGRDRLDRGEDSVAHRRLIRIDDEDRVGADLDRHVAAGPGQHVDAALHGQDFDLTGARVGRTMRPREILRCPALLGADPGDGTGAEKGCKSPRVAGHFATPLALIICFNFSAYSG
jgi:hypothetical protein